MGCQQGCQPPKVLQLPNLVGGWLCFWYARDHVKIFGLAIGTASSLSGGVRVYHIRQSSLHSELLAHTVQECIAMGL